MAHKTKLIFLIFFVIFFSLYEIKSQNFSWRKLENKAFNVGEKLLYEIKWEIISAGEAKIEVSSIQKIDQRDCYYIITTAKSHPFFDLFYKVRNTDESWIDVESLCSLRYSKRQREASYSKDETVLFDHIHGKFNIIETNQQKEMPEFSQDILSSLYFLRAQQISVGKEFIINTLSGDKIYNLKVVVHKKETINVSAGKFDCFVIEPLVEKMGGMLFKAKGKLWIWLSADEKKIPVFMKSKINIGYITAELVSYQTY